MIRPEGPDPRMRLSRIVRRLSIVVLLAGSGACAARLTPLPDGTGAPFAAYAEAYAAATARCRGVRTYAAIINLSGRAGADRLRGRVDAGFSEPGRVRLEGRPPALAFGRPYFILVSRGSEATLLLPRDRRVLTGEPAEAIIEALTGVALTPDELRAALGGCGLGVVAPTGGRAYEDGIAAVDAGGPATTWIRRADGGWRPYATVRGPLQVRYEEFAGAYPSRIRIRTAPADEDARADLTLRLSDVDVNIDLGPEVFEEAIPDDAVPITLDELRRARNPREPLNP